LACLFLSGALGLAYEIAWIRMASLVFGAASFALSTVLAVFFAGIALGSWFFGRRAARSANPLRLYAVLEAGVGVLALLTPTLFAVADGIYERFYPALFDHFAALSALRFAGVAAILLPPTVLMGGSLPLFCQAYVRRPDRIARTVGLLYGTNTLGAVLGCAAAGFWLIPNLGVHATIHAGGVLNLAIAAAILALPIARGDIRAPDPTPLPAPVPPLEPQRTRWVLPLLVFGTGFVALSNEVLWARHLTLIFHNTVYTYTITLTVVLLGIVLGSAVSGRLFDTVRHRALAFGAAQVVTGLSVVAALHLPPAFWRAWLDPTDLRAQVAAALLLLLLPAFCSGLSFPLAVRMVVEQPAQSGAGVGRMTALNTAGGIVGSLATGFWALPALGLDRTVTGITGASLALGFCAWAWLGSGVARWVLAAAATALWLAAPPLLGVRLPADHLGTPDELVDFEEGLSAFMAVVRGDGVLELEIDRMWQGELRKNHQIMAAHVPALFTRKLDDVLVIGLGPGQTASRFLLYGIDRLDCVELERELPGLIRRHFDAAWMDDPRLHVVIEDGRNYITHTDRRYDLISVEVGQVFRPGLAGFYSLEFYRRARERLKSGGILSQFLPIGFFTPDQLRAAIRTFVDAFPESALWYNKEELLLLGSDQPLHLGEEQLARLEDPGVRRDLEFAYWGGPTHWLNQREVLLAGHLLGGEALARVAGDTPPYRDDRPQLEYEISEYGARQEPAVLALIEANLSPVAPLLDAPPSPESAARIEALRRVNLRDLRARKLMKQARAFAATGNSQEADRRLQSAIQWNPENRWVRFVLGNNFVMQNLPLTAVDEYRRALAIDPDFIEARHNLGSVLATVGEIENAIAQQRAVLTLAPDFGPAHVSLARALLERGDAEQALVHAERGVELEGRRNLNALEALARAAAATGDRDRAQAAARDALVLAEAAGLEKRARALRESIAGDP
jgi:spermidine synthase